MANRIGYLFIGLILFPSIILGQVPSRISVTNEVDSLDQTIVNWKDLGQSIDSLFHFYLNKEEPIQGGVINVVSSDSILFSKGYGFADIANEKVFSPEETNVMVASVSKLFTTTAILQLIERGHIDLDQEISTLIGDIQIDNPFDQPILIRHILTHTAGFDDTSIGNEATHFENLKSLRNHLKKRLTPIVWEPGKYFNYSNIGMVLLAHIVENVSGITFDEYLSKHVYHPLGMNHSGFSYKEASVKNMMTRYKWKEDENDQLFLDDTYGIKYTHQIGAGGFQTTANDMTNFMQMYLNKGSFGGHAVLESRSIDNAFKAHHYAHALIDRQQGLGWKVRNSDGLAYNYHGGDDTGIESIVVVIPDADIAFFFASNNNEASDLKFEIRNLILDQVNKHPSKKFSENFNSTSDLSKLVGTYQYMNDGQTSIERLFSYLFGNVYQVKTNRNGISINDNEYIEVDTLLFERVDKEGTQVSFIIDKNGSHYSTGYSTYRCLAFYERPALHLKLMIGSFLIFFVTNIIWLIQYLKHPAKLNTAKLFTGLASFCLLLFFALLALTTQGGSSKYGVPEVFKSYFTFPLLSIFLFLFGLFQSSKIFKNKSISLASKIHFSIHLVALLICLSIFYFYNLLGYNF